MAAPPEKLNRFKPAEPSIPGVPQHAPEEKKAQELTRAGPKPSWQSPRMMAVAGIGGIALLAGVALAWEVMKPAAPPAPVVIAAPDAAAKPDDATPTVTVTPQLPDAPGPVATVDELAKPWSFAKFQIHRLSGETANGMVIRLPAAPGYWGLLSVAPYGRCDMELESDLKKLREQYGYAAAHPMVVDSCSQVVYDPLALGVSGHVWVRGKVAAGPGIRPPFEVEIKVEKGFVIAARSE